MSEASDHDDGGSIVLPEETALVWSPETGFRLVMPEYGDDEQVPAEVAALAMMSLLTEDEDWMAELLQRFDDDAPE
jgi:hypothetical protein